MAHQALYRKYRPQTFDDVVEQQHVVTTLKNVVMSGNTAHAYLFCGTRGTGKTTMAKIFARAVNCLHPDHGNPCNVCEVCKGILDGTILDVTEIDAASNNSVDNVRSIIDEVVYRPTRAQKKVYIIDEVHMLSSGAFNALLKTLEEPPEHVLFILATTEPHKLPATVLSRCQRFDFRRISNDGIEQRLIAIAGDEHVSLTDDAVSFIASLSGGALRDATSILDQVIATGKNPLELEDVQEVVGVAPNQLVLDTVNFLIDHNGKEAIASIDRLIADGKEPSQFLQRLIQLLRDILVFKASNSLEHLLSMTVEEREMIPVLAGKVSMVEALAAVRELSGLESGIRWSSSPRILLEIAFLRICSREMNIDEDSLSDRLSLLEEKLRQLEKGVANRGIQRISKTEKAVYREEPPQNQQPPRVRETVEKADKIKPARDPLNHSKPFEAWGQVIENIRKSGRMKLFTSLVDATAVWKDQNTVKILMPEEDQFKQQVVSKTENVEVIIESIRACTGLSLQVDLFKSIQEEKKQQEIPEQILDFARKNGLKLDVVEE